MEIKDRVALITGGASGLGRASAEILYKAGAKVVILDLNEDGAKAVAESMGSNAAYKKCDISIEGDVTAAIDFAMDTFGRIDIMINNAAFAVAEKTADKKKGPHSLENFMKVIRVCTIGTFDFSRQAACKMMLNEADADGAKGVIINTSTVASMDGQIGQVAYSAAKGAVNSMTLTMARDLSSEGIRVITICPGIFNTPALQGLPDNVKDALGKMVPYPPRLGKAEEYALMVKTAVECSYLNGEVIRLDGAIRMQPK